MHRYLAIVLAVSISSTAWGEEIPLKSIWALDMPGTKDIRELEPKPESGISADELISRSLVEQIRWSLNPNFWPKEGHNAGKAFVVAGSGIDALREAHGVLADRNKRASSIAADKEMTLVFYAYNSGRSVLLDHVVRKGDTITVKYPLHAHEVLKSTTHFALIPLGKLSPGKFQVNIQRSPDTGPGGLVRRFKTVPADRIVCGSFAFDTGHEDD